MTEVVVLLLDLGDFVNVLHVHRAHHLVHRLARAFFHARAALVSVGGGRRATWVRSASTGQTFDRKDDKAHSLTYLEKPGGGRALDLESKRPVRVGRQGHLRDGLRMWECTYVGEFGL